MNIFKRHAQRMRERADYETADQNTKAITPAELCKVLSLDPLAEIAATAICPRCGHANAIKWAQDGRVSWHPQSEHCAHYQGAYSTGNLTTVQARFK